MSQEEFAELPDQVRVREVHLLIQQTGFRPKQIIVVTTLNLLRTVMWQAGKKTGVCPMRISLQGTRQHFGNFCPQLYKAGAKKRFQLYNTLLTVVTDKLLPERPYRYEPRLKKQRPKPYGWMQQPRHVLKRKLAV